MKKASEPSMIRAALSGDRVKKKESTNVDYKNASKFPKMTRARTR